MHVILVESEGLWNAPMSISWSCYYSTVILNVTVGRNWVRGTREPPSHIIFCNCLWVYNYFKTKSFFPLLLFFVFVFLMLWNLSGARKATQGKGHWTRAWRVSRSRSLEGRQAGERALLWEKTTRRAWRCGRTWHFPMSSSRWLIRKLGERRLGKEGGRAGEAAGMAGKHCL